MMVESSIRDLFQGRRVPAWLLSFDQKPDVALEDLLTGGTDLEHLQPEEPTVVLLGWLRGFARSSFPQMLDAALAGWVRRSWGDPALRSAGGSSALTAVAWVGAGTLIARARSFERSAQALRELFPEDRTFLRTIGEGPARDPEGSAWLALAEHQQDRSLLDQW